VLPSEKMEQHNIVNSSKIHESNISAENIQSKKNMSSSSSSTFSKKYLDVYLRDSVVGTKEGRYTGLSWTQLEAEDAELTEQVRFGAINFIVFMGVLYCIINILLQ
jgi:hypothetical protein